MTPRGPGKRRRRMGSSRPRKTRSPQPAPPPKLRLKLRSKLVIAMVFAALVPVILVAVLATRVILSNLEGGLRDQASGQLTVGVNLVLRAVERISDEAVQLSESQELLQAIRGTTQDIEKWVAREAPHIPSARLQLFDATGKPLFDRVLGGAVTRFRNAGVLPVDPIVAAGKSWTRTVSLVELGDRTMVRAVSPIVDPGLALEGVLVLSTPLDGDFADSIKGALSADVLLGGTSGTLEVTFRSDLGRRAGPVTLSDEDRRAVLRGGRVIRHLDLAGEGGTSGQYQIAVTALLDSRDRPVGILGVAVDREPLAATKRLAVRSLGIGGVIAISFALVLALFWSRRLGAPIARLHRGATAVSRGDLEHRIDIPGGDELTDLATAFNQMTSTLKDNQARLAARMREIVALHDAGRAVSSVIDLDSVSRKIVDAVARTFDIQLAALWIVEGGGQPQLRASAARARRADVSSSLATDEALAAAEELRSLAEQVQRTRQPVRLARAAQDPVHGPAAHEAGAPGPLVALPLDRTRQGAPARVVGVLAVGRAEGLREFSEADFNLLTTFADQAGAAVENALLYQEVREASEELERKVRLRTSELTAINTELGRALAELREAQAQLVLSERMAGLGLLVAGVAHEINSPTAAIRGSIESLPAGLARVARHDAELAARASSPEVARGIASFLERTAPQLAERPLPTGLVARRAAKELALALEATPGGPELGDLSALAAELADVGATAADARAFVEALGPDRGLGAAAIAALTDHVYLHRTASTVRHAVGQIQRIVGALKSYSHLDQQATRVEADLHEGLETTLTLLHHALRDIVVERRYGNLPRVPVYVDELNQVWTNLIQNAQQALAGKGTITIETAVEDTWAIVRVVDDGPGVPAEALPQIFEPFFTTKAKGEGTGLGLGISRQIVDKHGGTMTCVSRPGRTAFEVRLPIGVAGGEVAS